MKMEIKFRGKDIETGEWICGDLIQRIGYMPSIMFPYESNGKIRYGECAVKRETVGQFVFCKDRNKKEIFEWDIVKQYFEFIIKDGETLYGYNIGVVRLTSQGAIISPCKTCFDTGEEFHVKCKKLRWNRTEIIGNIHDNPELLQLTKKE